MNTRWQCEITNTVPFNSKAFAVSPHGSVEYSSHSFGGISPIETDEDVCVSVCFFYAGCLLSPDGVGRLSMPDCSQI